VKNIAWRSYTSGEFESKWRHRFWCFATSRDWDVWERRQLDLSSFLCYSEAAERLYIIDDWSFATAHHQRKPFVKAYDSHSHALQKQTTEYVSEPCLNFLFYFLLLLFIFVISCVCQPFSVKNKMNEWMDEWLLARILNTPSLFACLLQ